MNRPPPGWHGRPPVLDLFAGAGGWDEGLRALGYETLGIEADQWACNTARAAGLARLQADVSALDPGGLRTGLPAFHTGQPGSNLVCGTIRESPYLAVRGGP